MPYDTLDERNTHIYQTEAVLYHFTDDEWYWDEQDDVYINMTSLECLTQEQADNYISTLWRWEDPSLDEGEQNDI